MLAIGVNGHMQMDGHSPRSVWESSIRWSWTIMSRLRFGFGVELHPCMSTAFVMLHHYFRENPQPAYPLYVLITCSCLASLKCFEATRSLQAIFNEFLKVCRTLAQRSATVSLADVLRLSEFTDRDLTSDEILSMNRCEIEILRAHKFQARLELSFDYTERFVDAALRGMEGAPQLKEEISKGHCFALLSVRYLDFVPEAVAVAATQRALAGREIPEVIGEWFRGVLARHGRDAIDAAVELLEQQQKRIEPNRTAQQ
jgi:hypothetical protein